MQELYNIGIVGLGHIARHQIAALEHSTRCRLIAGCDTDTKQFALLDSSASVYTDIDAMLKLDELDVVVVASPNQLHVAHGIQVMTAGKWVMMEKPLAETRAEFEQFRLNREALDGRCTLALHAAHGVEVEWFCNERTGERGDRASLASFDAKFYDPYVKNGKALQSVRSLGGSWVDSGINALSVIARLVKPETLELRDSRMIRLAGSGCREVQGTVEFIIDRHGSRGAGSIDTNWTLGCDSKTTLVSFVDDSVRYLLDHSAQQVVKQENQHTEVLFTCNNGLPRLTNHYIGVFDDLARQLDNGNDNFPYCEKLHCLLYEAEEADS